MSQRAGSLNTPSYALKVERERDELRVKLRESTDYAEECRRAGKWALDRVTEWVTMDKYNMAEYEKAEATLRKRGHEIVNLQGASIRKDEGDARDSQPPHKTEDFSGLGAHRGSSAGLTPRQPDHLGHAVGQSNTPRCRAIDRKHNAMRDRLPPFPGCLEVSAIEDARNSAFVALAHTLERELSRCHSQVHPQRPARYCPKCNASGDFVGEVGAACWGKDCGGVIASGMKP